MSTAVTQLEQQLEAARKVEAEQRCENAKHEVQRLRHEGAALLAELRPLAAQVHEAQNERLKLHGLLVQARNQIAAYSTPLSPLEFPSDEAITAHAAQLEAWKQKQKELLAKHGKIRECEWSARIRGMPLQSQINRLEFMIKNLTAIAEGRRPGETTGGLFTTEDFLGHTDRRFD